MENVKCNHNVKIKFPQDKSKNNLIHIIKKEEENNVHTVNKSDGTQKHP